VSGKLLYKSIDLDVEALAPCKPQTMSTAQPTVEPSEALAGLGDSELVYDSVLSLCKTDAAKSLIDEVWRLVEVWDDAIDGDKAKPAACINATFEWALFGIHSNEFLRENPYLLRVLQVSQINWQIANELEQVGSRDALAHSYNLRCSAYDFFVGVVLADAGPVAAKAAARALRFAIHADPFIDYLSEHLKES